MIRTLALLCVVAAPALALGGWDPCMKVRFDVNPFEYGKTAFYEMPINETVAISKGWQNLTQPDCKSGLSSLTSMWCPENDYTLCIKYDDTGYIAGYQINLRKDRFEPFYDTTTQGFVPWCAELNGESVDFLSISSYFVHKEFLEKDAATRLSARDPDSLLQDEDVWVTGFNGEMYNVSRTTSYYTDCENDYTKQSCIPFMGHHYYYKMTKDLECSASTIFPWFPLVYSKQLIGMGFMMFGNLTILEGEKNHFENPSAAAVKTIVNNGPECLYNLASSPGAFTMHVYYINTPWTISCVFEN